MAEDAIKREGSGILIDLNNLFDDTGKFTDDILENNYQKYVKRNKAANNADLSNIKHYEDIAKEYGMMRALNVRWTFVQRRPQRSEEAGAQSAEQSGIRGVKRPFDPNIMYI